MPTSGVTAASAIEQLDGAKRDYALSHLASHLHTAELYAQVEQLVAKSWLETQVCYGEGKIAFLRDAAIAMQSSSAVDISHDMVQVWRGAYVTACVRSTVGSYPPRVIQLLIRAGRPREAKAFAALSPAPFIRCVGFCDIARWAWQTHDAESATEAMESALAAAEAEVPVVSRAEAFAKVAQCALDSGNQRVLLTALDRLSQGEMGHWMGRLLSDLSEAAVRHTRPDLLSWLLGMARSIPHDDPNLSNDRVEALTAIVSAMSHFKMHTGICEVLEYARTMKQEELSRLRLLAALVAGFASIGDRGNVDSILTMIDSSSSLDERVELLAQGAEAYSRLAQPVLANSLLEGLSNELGRVEETLSRDYNVRIVADSYARIANFDRALQTVETIVKPQRRSEAFVSLGRIALHEGNLPLAREIVGKSISAARLVDSEDFDAIYGPVETLLKAATFSWEIGMQDEALSISFETLDIPDGLCDPMYGPAGLSSAVQILGSAKARAGLERAIAIASDLRDSTFRDEALQATVTEIAKAGWIDWALALSAEHQVLGIDGVAEAAMEAGHTEMALGLLKRILAEVESLPFDNREALAQSRIAHELLKFGALDEAYEVAAAALESAQSMEAESVSEDIGANGVKAVVLAQVALTLARLGKTQEAMTAALEAWSESNPAVPRVRSSVSHETWKNLVSMYGRRTQVMNLLSRATTCSKKPEVALRLALESSDQEILLAAIRGIARESQMTANSSSPAMLPLLLSYTERAGIPSARAQDLLKTVLPITGAVSVDRDEYEEILRGNDVTPNDGDLHEKLLEAVSAPQGALEAWRKACLSAKDDVRKTVLLLLHRMIPLVGSFDEGKTLVRLYLSLREVSDWWRSKDT